MADERKFCNNRACAMHGQKVTTALTECISCGRDLVKDNPLGDLFGALGGIDGDALLKKLRGK